MVKLDSRLRENDVCEGKSSTDVVLAMAMMQPANSNRRLNGHLAENIMHFARVLRAAGIPVGPGAVLDALDAAGAGPLRRREDFYWTLHSVFISNAASTRNCSTRLSMYFGKNPKCSNNSCS